MDLAAVMKSEAPQAQALARFRGFSLGAIKAHYQGIALRGIDGARGTAIGGCKGLSLYEPPRR